MMQLSAGTGARPRSLLALILLLPAVQVFGAGDSPVKLTSIAGVFVGQTVERAHKTLEPLGTGGAGEEQEERGAVKEAWILKSGQFKSLAYKAGRSGKILWVTGWIRSGVGLPFGAIGDLHKATRAQASIAIWNVDDPAGAYRIVARGPNQRAAVVTIMSLESREED
jgi:hypothetical protein